MNRQEIAAARCHVFWSSPLYAALALYDIGAEIDAGMSQADLGSNLQVGKRSQNREIRHGVFTGSVWAR